ncbi:SigE family RNA polymerase sigma factor [Hamadaea tsunoensis]|uniref:SigE family RNA polymerase sigma factor n=1 Tax=Hamadaea tsunoensis TaxID=53368 RepID=UPI000411D7FB|nr:SigE family RNA polymerase sigma factor [Hamadaea tsunoensis]
MADHGTFDTFEDFVAAHGESLLRLAFVLTGDAHRAEDLAQTALADAFRHWRKVRAARSPLAYVRRMLLNTHLSWWRRRSAYERPAEAVDVVDRGDHEEAVATRDQLRRLLGRLAPRARTVLVLRYYADLDDAAIAEAMGVTASAVRATASRALATLRASTAELEESR